MKVIDVTWLSHDALEAHVTVSDGAHACVCFSQPCIVAVGDEIADPLHPFSVTAIERVEGRALGVAPTDDGGSARRVVAQVLDARARVLRVGGLRFELEEALPGDVVAGDAVRLTCARIDLW